MAASVAGAGIVSGLSGRSASKQAKQARKDARQAQAMQIQKLDEFKPMVDRFSRLGEDQFNKYQEMFGGLEETLSDYYMNLNPDELAAQGNQTAQQQFQLSMDQVNSQMAAQGIMGSGVQSQLALGQGNQMAQTKAQNVMNAPHEVAQMQQGWMNYGANRQDQAFNQMGQGVQAQSNLAGMYGNAYQGQANQSMQMAGNYQSQANQGMASMGSALGAATYFFNKD